VLGNYRQSVISFRFARLGALFALMAACGQSEGGTSFHGAKLGMAPRDVRDRFDLAPLGAFKVTSPGDELILDWAPSHAGEGTVDSARFEFHAGMLVAVRANLASRDPDAAGPSLVTTKNALVARKTAQGVDYTLMARDCPTHREEEKRLLQGAEGH